ncbi:N-acetylmuramoyl-L-alanine amidase [Spirulina subsalsa]|uniref:N-acetylmuramoyl-L-alanine amidase n=1 Tax=Spirulina subsalsa TaxID=54311 RepID=UPI0002EB597B|nr:N-acetylmuramoyl-L-alanine amidase [Spirulina subsalsa]
MRRYWLFLSLVGALLYASPAEAARLLFWRYEAAQNRLTFTTDQGVQPRAQLIANPTRLVIDLPGISLGRPSERQRIGGAVAEVRSGQFNANTARLVVELAPGYTYDPQGIQFRGMTSTQWSVQLPQPQRLGAASSPAGALPSLEIRESSSQTQAQTASPTPQDSDFQITRNGFFVRLGNNARGQVAVRRSRNGQQVQIDLNGIMLPDQLVDQGFEVNRYGVGQVQFSQIRPSPPLARITMDVSVDSPDWQASLARSGGLAIVPAEGSAVLDQDAPSSSTAQNTLTTVQSVELGLGNQILIRGDRALRGTGQWDSRTGVYQLTIPNARLAPDFPNPQLSANSPVSQIRLRQQGDTVLVLIQPAPNIQVGRLSQLNDRLLSLQLNQGTTSALPPALDRPINIPVPPPERIAPPTPTLPPAGQPSRPLPQVPNTRAVVMLDPGHGGRDPGAVGIGGLQEKNVVLPISLRVAQLLEQQGVRVIMTRNNDTFVTLAGRAQMANRARATIFVSIHANAISMSRPDVNGVETFFFNSAGQRLASSIQNSILQSTSMNNRGVKPARFYVLRNTSMPSALVEVGFVTGNLDAPRLADPNFRNQMAEAIARGILLYLQQNRL